MTFFVLIFLALFWVIMAADLVIARRVQPRIRARTDKSVGFLLTATAALTILIVQQGHLHFAVREAIYVACLFTAILALFFLGRGLIGNGNSH